MAKIVRPNDIILNNQSRINMNVASSSNLGLINQGQLKKQAAQVELQKKQYVLNQQISDNIDKEGRRIFEESKAAYQASVLTDKMTSATESFVTQKLQRSNKVVDDKGNYTYMSLPKDMENIGNDILKNTLKDISDPDIARQFELRFKSYISSQKISALQTAAKQQMQIGLDTLDKGLGNIILQASKDSIDQMDTYYQQGEQALRDAMLSGIISKNDYESKIKQFNVILKDKILKNSIYQDRVSAIATLNKSATELGISEEQKSKYTKLLDTTLKSDRIAVKKAEELQAIDDAAEEVSIIDDLKSRMEADTLREDELLAFEDIISPPRFSQMKNEFVQQSQRKEAERKKMSDLFLRALEGDSLNDVSSGDINSLFDHMVRQRSHITQSEVTLSEQAQIAASLPRPVKYFAATLESNVKNGSPKNAAEMLAAYTYIKDRGKNTLDSGFSKDAIAIMEHTESLVNKGGLTQEEALIKARERLSKSSTELYKDALNEFNNEDFEGGDFTFSKVQDTAASDLELKPWFGKNSNIPLDIAYDYKNFVREGYAKLGDIDDAKKYAKQLMNRRYGKSKTNGKGESQYILRPPEKVWTNASSEDLRNILFEDITPVLLNKIKPKIKIEGKDIKETGTNKSLTYSYYTSLAGFKEMDILDAIKGNNDKVLDKVLKESIMIHSDDITSNQMTLTYNDKGEVVNEEVPTWTVTYINPITGDIEPLINPETGQIFRWSPMGTKYFDTKRAKLLSEAKLKSEEEKKGRYKKEKIKGPIGSLMYITPGTEVIKR